MKKLITSTFVAIAAIAIYACGGGEHKPIPGTEPKGEPTAASTVAAANPKGIGKFQNVEVPAALDHSMADKGEAVSKTKCLSCHKLSDEKLVGPGWKDVTKRRTPEWIMNFITNTEEMLEKDPEAIKSLEICLVRMPNQNLTDEEARQVYEYMRKVDGVK
ncbi:c-type cytochrome [Aridibaculum aurantiacum]|uniref:c-type cytochrome n=1 Tax=Aridibaculum aurantiacum TaxID=2810307 RepID=UPI001A973014|nr:cytochrome c [Aridibaculum aurantiacum]